MYDANHTDEWAAQRNYHEQLTSFLQAREGMCVLDAGCGQGVVASYIAGHTGAHVTGITITPYEVSSAAKVAARQGVAGKTAFLHADYSAMPFPDNSFDLIYTTESLCHAVDLPKVIHEFWRVLRPGGRVVLAEYELDYSRFHGDEHRAAEILLHDVGCFGMYQIGLGQFEKYLRAAGFRDVVEAADWTQAMQPSAERLERKAKPFMGIAVRLASTRFSHFFINILIARMYAEGIRHKEFFYKVFTATKPLG